MSNSQWGVAWRRCVLSAAAVCSGWYAPSAAEPWTQQLVAGRAAPLPEKERLGRREDLVTMTAGASVLVGSATGMEAVGTVRFLETVGLGLGARVAGESGAFLRMELAGLAIRHWSMIGFIDYQFARDWWFGGALVAPITRNAYVRISVSTTGDASELGGGLEYDLW